MENEQDKRINRYIFLAVIIIFALMLLFSLQAFFTAFLGAVIFYVLSKRMVNWLLKKKGWKKSGAALLIIFISFFVFLLPLLLFIVLVYNKVQYLGSHVQDLVVVPLQSLDNSLQKQFHFVLISEKNIAQAQNYLTDFITSLLNQGLNLLGALSMMYFFLYFMIVNINKMEAAILYYLPFNSGSIEKFGNELKLETFSNAIGIPLIAIAQGGIAYLSFLIVSIPDPLFWAVLTGIASVIPVIGTGLVWIPIGIFLLAHHQLWQGIIILAWGLTILSSTDSIVRFLLAKKMADVHPVVTVLGVIIGLQYFGITGLVFGPLLISYFLMLIKLYYLSFGKKIPPLSKTEKYPKLEVPLLNLLASKKEPKNA